MYYYQQPYGYQQSFGYGYNCCNTNNRGVGCALILVLFILLVIIGASKIF